MLRSAKKNLNISWKTKIIVNLNNNNSTKIIAVTKTNFHNTKINNIYETRSAGLRLVFLFTSLFVSVPLRFGLGNLDGYFIFGRTMWTLKKHDWNVCRSNWTHMFNTSPMRKSVVKEEIYCQSITESWPLMKVKHNWKNGAKSGLLWWWFCCRLLSIVHSNTLWFII